MQLKGAIYLGDDREAALALEKALRDEGLPLAIASGDLEGMRKAAEMDIDVVIWDRDNNEPGEPIPVRQIRGVGLNRQPVVALVRQGDVGSALASLAEGASEFLFKSPIQENPAPRLIQAVDSRQRDMRLAWCSKAIEDTSGQLKAIVGTLKDPAYIVSPDYLILYMNRAAQEIFGEGLWGGVCYRVFYDREEPCGVCVSDKGPARWRSVLKNGKSYRFVSTLIRTGGGEAEKLAVGTDITLDEEVRKIHKTFISNVSHDLRTPLAAIDQYLNIMLEGQAGEMNADQKKYLEVIKRSSFRLHNLIENLIDANNILSGRFKLRMQVTGVKEILDIVLPLLRAQAREKGLALQVTVSDDLPPLYCDSMRIAQVIANVVGNSVKFTERGSVHLRAGFMPGDQARIILSVEDPGIGIPKEDLGKIFDLFYRVEQDQVYVEEGAGLGLSISRDIVRAHGGTLWAESVEGRGSAFHFTLPTRDVAAPSG